MLDKIERIIVAALKLIVIALGIVMTLVVFAQVVLRYIVQQPFGWTEELARLLLLLWVMVGGVLSFRYDRHLALDFLDKIVPDFARRILVILRQVLVIVFCFFMVREGFRLTSTLGARTPILSVPLRLVYQALPIAMGLIGIWAVVLLVRAVIGLRPRPVPQDPTRIVGDQQIVEVAEE